MVGQEEDAREYLKELEGRAEQGFSIGRWIASVYAALGEGDEAMKWLDQAVDHRDPAVFHAMTDPFFRDFREDPRFLRVMRRIGLKPDGPTPGGKKG